MTEQWIRTLCNQFMRKYPWKCEILMEIFTIWKEPPFLTNQKSDVIRNTIYLHVLHKITWNEQIQNI